MSRIARCLSTPYIDAFGPRGRSPPTSAPPSSPPWDPDEADSDAVAVVRRGARLPWPGEVVLEDGTSLGRLDAVPHDAPYGYHRLTRDDGREQLLITGPGRCHLPAGLRAWGWAIQLAPRARGAAGESATSATCASSARGRQRQGAGFLAVGPLGAPNPGPKPEPSPYYPSTRRFGNPLHLRIEEVPGAEASATSSPSWRRPAAP